MSIPKRPLYFRPQLCIKICEEIVVFDRLTYQYTGIKYTNILASNIPVYWYQIYQCTGTKYARRPPFDPRTYVGIKYAGRAWFHPATYMKRY